MEALHSLGEVIAYHKKHYPESELQDWIKLIYQNEFGGGHLVTDLAKAEKSIHHEMTTALPTQRLVEPLGNGLSRLHLAPYLEVSPATVAQMFAQSASEVKGSYESLQQKLDFFLSLIDDSHWYQLAEKELLQYKANKYPLVRHSQHYRDCYQPAYRVLRNEFADYLPLFSYIKRRLSQQKQTVIAIDGGSTSGKSTLAQRISQLYDCNVIAMDDFFLRPEQRTPERYAEPGGNIDYERFASQVAKRLACGEKITYQVFDCSVMEFSKTVTLSPKPLIILEGSYSHHPNFSMIEAYRVFLDIPVEVQLARLSQRNTPQMVERFIKEWIPLERAYCKAFSIKEKADIVFKQT